MPLPNQIVAFDPFEFFLELFFLNKVTRNDISIIKLLYTNKSEYLIYESTIVKIYITDNSFSNLIGSTEILRGVEIRNETGEYKQIESIEELRKSLRDELYDYGTNRIALAEMLKNGMVSVYDKRRTTKVTFIKMRFYDYGCGPLCGESIWYFYLPDGTLFFKAIVGMS